MKTFKSHFIIIVAVAAFELIVYPTYSQENSLIQEIEKKVHVSDSLNHLFDPRALILGIEAVDLAEKNLPLTETLEFAYQNMAAIYAKIGDFRKAAKFSLKQILNREARMDKPDRHTSYVWGTVGSHFLNANMKDSCFYAFKRAIQIRNLFDKREVFYASSLNNLALAYEKFGQLDSAEHYFKLSIYFLKKYLDLNDGQGVFINIVEGNLADVLIARNKNQEAKKYYENIVKNGIIDRLGAFSNHLKSYFAIADITRKNDLETYIELPSKIKKLIAEYDFEVIPEYKIKLEKLNYEIALLNDDLEAARIHYEAAEQIRDSLLLYESGAKLALVEQLNNFRNENLRREKELNVLELEKVNQEAKLQEQSNQINLLILLTGLVASIVVGVFLLLNAYKRRKALETERQLAQLQIENQNLEEKRLIQELDSQKSDITQLALDNTRKRAWNREFIDRIKELKKEKNIGVDKLIKELELELNNQVYLDEKIGVFHDKIDQVNADFYTSLDKTYPGLTKGERELCGMIKLKLSGKEIANVRNVHPRSVSKAKQRLRNKLSLEPNADLYQLMEALN